MFLLFLFKIRIFLNMLINYINSKIYIYFFIQRFLLNIIIVDKVELL
jgi:hypothetical protein